MNFVGLLFLLFFSFALNAFEMPKIPSFDLSKNEQWKNRSVVKIDHPLIILNEDSYIQADELVLEGTLVTNGYLLKIDVKKLVFKERGQIVAFNDPASSGGAGKNGDNGGVPCETKRNCFAKKGRHGWPGTKGQDGNQNPKPIIIFAAETEGVVKIDGTGQTGGEGGRGGKGGKGGQGVPGRNGEAKCFSSDTLSKPGGRGGIGGKGGKGGPGGKGGAPVTIVFVDGSEKPIDHSFIVSKVGSPGKGGRPGVPGRPGIGGRGGYGHTKHCVFKVERVKSSENGPVGIRQRQNLGKGRDGRKGREVYYSKEIYRFLPRFILDEIIRPKRLKVKFHKSQVKFPFSSEIKDQLKTPRQGASHRKLVLSSKLNRSLNLEKPSVFLEPDEAANFLIIPYEDQSKNTIFLSSFQLENLRKKLLSQWIDFHWVRSYLYLVSDSLTLLSDSRGSEIPSFVEEEDELRSYLEEFLRENVILDQRVDDVIDFWEMEYIAPLKEHRVNHWSIATSEALVSLLKKIKTNSSRQEINQAIEDFMVQKNKTILTLESNLSLALSGCKKLNDYLSMFRTPVVNLTSHYIVPACKGDPDFTNKENLMATISVFNLGQSYVSAGLKRSIDTKLVWFLETFPANDVVDMTKRSNRPRENQLSSPTEVKINLKNELKVLKENLLNRRVL